MTQLVMSLSSGFKQYNRFSNPIKTTYRVMQHDTTNALIGLRAARFLNNPSLSRSDQTKEAIDALLKLALKTISDEDNIADQVVDMLETSDCDFQDSTEKKQVEEETVEDGGQGFGVTDKEENDIYKDEEGRLVVTAPVVFENEASFKMPDPEEESLEDYSTEELANELSDRLD